MNNGKAALTVVYDNDNKRAVQMSGSAEVVDLEEVTTVHELYSEKIGQNDKRLEETLANTEDGRAYWRFTPEVIHLWDEKEFPDSPKQIVKD